jgi:hypothetical protein
MVCWKAYLIDLALYNITLVFNMTIVSGICERLSLLPGKSVESIFT